jgi:hypothetical protein
VAQENRFFPEGQNLFTYWKQHAGNELTKIAETVALDILITLCHKKNAPPERANR